MYDANQSQSLKDIATEIVIDNDVCKTAESGNEISGNVKFDSVISSPGEVNKNTETVKNHKSKK